MNQHPSLSIVVLNWNGRSLLPHCLTSLTNLSYPNYNITVVDNASTDDSVPFIRQQFPNIQLITSPHNLGFAKGNNLALRQLQSEFVALVNPDVTLTPNWLEQILIPFQANHQIGVAGCKLYYPGGNIIQHGGGQIIPPRATSNHFGVGEVDQGQCDTLREVTYVIGAAMFIRRSVLAQIGLLDEGFFLYYEDVDFCLRAQQAGYRVVYVPTAVGTHLESATTQKNSPAYFQQFHTSRWRFLLKHYPLEQLIHETAPAEKTWLTLISPSEQEATQKAYQTTNSHLPAILQARAAHHPNVAEHEPIQQLILDLIQTSLALTPNHASLFQASTWGQQWQQAKQRAISRYQQSLLSVKTSKQRTKGKHSL